jgi:protein-tyrosine sulfotransferase
MQKNKTKSYNSPGVIKKTIGRARRLALPAIVDFIDYALKLKNGNKFNHPYYISAENEYQPFFIIGSGRSGNTLLRKLLVENSEAVIPPEIPGLGNTIRCFSRYRGVEWGECVEKTLKMFFLQANVDIETKDKKGNIIKYNLVDDLELDFDHLEAKLSNLPPKQQALSTIITEIYNQYSINKTGKVLPWGDKTPWNVFHFARIEKVFPKARYIHMVRDGRDVVASYVSSFGEEKNITVRDASHRWCDSLLMIRRRIENEPEGFFLEIRYEDLVRNHNEITTKIMQFLNLTKKDGRFLLGDNDDTNMLHHQNLNLPVSGRSIGSFKSKLSNKEKTQMMKIIRPYLHMYNYE